MNAKDVRLTKTPWLKASPTSRLSFSRLPEKPPQAGFALRGGVLYGCPLGLAAYT